MSLTPRKATGLILIAVTTLLFHPISQPGADTTGRDFSRCVQACNAAKQSCRDLCVTECRTLFPGNSQKQSGCSGTCKSGCVESEQQCKAVCRAIKQGTSP